ncbi:helix-turn-helix transcriptional regulator [Nesterenkonia sp. K-15-9-6]|uniref:helix-turn-helix transcriptional regulator n=1 Tax=Nesterenkonia sp. K-15-9-6 TaxID=3093918 RepID=UPI004044CECA
MPRRHLQPDPRSPVTHTPAPTTSDTPRSEPLTGPELRLRREALGMSQPELAELLEVTQVTIHRWETQQRQISTEARARAVDLLTTRERFVEATRTAALRQLSNPDRDGAVHVRTYLRDSSLHAAVATAATQNLPATLHRLAIGQAIAAHRVHDPSTVVEIITEDSP